MSLRVKVTWAGVIVPGGGITTFHFASAAAAAQDCVDAVVDFMETVDNDMNNNETWRVENVVEEFDEATGALEGVVICTGATAAGASAVEALPWATQGVLRLNTNAFAGGRRIRGRIFLPGFTEGVSPGGIPSGTLVANVTAAGNALAAAAPTWGVWSRKNGSIGIITGTQMWDKWGVLRSRRS